MPIVMIIIMIMMIINNTERDTERQRERQRDRWLLGLTHIQPRRVPESPSLRGPLVFEAPPKLCSNFMVILDTTNNT